MDFSCSGKCGPAIALLGILIPGRRAQSVLTYHGSPDRSGHYVVQR
jgi:hypothetical protein